MAGPLDKVIHPFDQKRIIDAIASAERLTSGEIAVHVEGRCAAPEPKDRAAELFQKLGVTRTQDRNGVLIYVAVRDRRFALMGDSAIDEPPASPFWQDANKRLTIALRRGAVGDGICGAIAAVGQQLCKRFPRSAEHKNQLENELTTDPAAL